MRTTALLAAPTKVAAIALAYRSRPWLKRLCYRSVFVQVLNAGNGGAIEALMWPAFEKRQDTKSRSAGQRRCGARYEDFAAGGY